jgi:hypothetical protein
MPAFSTGRPDVHERGGDVVEGFPECGERDVRRAVVRDVPHPGGEAVRQATMVGYCCARATLPDTVIAQLTSEAYVPVISGCVSSVGGKNITVAVTLNGQVAELGVSVADMLEPFTVPINVPPVLPLAFEKVNAQVPVSDEPDWTIVIWPLPVPMAVSMIGPAHVPASDVEGEDGLPQPARKVTRAQGRHSD